MARPSAPAIAEKSAKGTVGKASSAKANKAAAPKKTRDHPPYFEMIKEAIMALKERTGSSQYAIAKFIEENQKDLPSNFKKLLLVQLKKLVASGKLTKVKASYKLSATVKPRAAAPEKPKSASVAKKAPAKKKIAADVKGRDKKTVKVVALVKEKAAAKVKKTAAKVKKTPAKVKKTPAKVKKTPVKKPKSIKPPAKKMMK